MSRLSFSTGREENCRSRDAPSEKKRIAGDEHFRCHRTCSRNHNVILTKVHSHAVMRDEEQFSDDGLTDDEWKNHLLLDEPIGSMPTAKIRGKRSGRCQRSDSTQTVLRRLSTMTDTRV